MGDHQAESTVRTLKAQMRATRFALESRLGRQLAHDDPILTWIPTLAGDTIARFRRGPDGKTPWEREQGRKWAGDSLEFGERFFMKEAKERASGAVKRDWEPRLIEARCLGQHARTGAMIGITTDGIVCGRLGRRLPEAERWDQTGWQDLKGVPWDLRPTGVPEPEVDVEAQPGAAEAERRERRWQKATREIRTSQAERRNAPRRSARETSQIRRAIFSTCISVRCSRGRRHPIQENSSEGHSRERILCDQERCGKVRADSTMSSMRGHRKEFQDDMLTTTSVAIGSESC